MKFDKVNDTFALRWAKKIKAINMLGGKCEICGINDIFVLDFHHNGFKDNNLSHLFNVGSRWIEIEKEMQRCSLMCSNCHAEHHYVDLIKEPNSGARKLKADILRQIECLKCSRCGYAGQNLNSLVFHHNDCTDKLFCLSNAFSKKIPISVEQLWDEVGKCDVICRNCHRKAHADIDRVNKYRDEINEKIKEHIGLRPKLDRDEILKMYNDGMRQVDIVNHFGCAKSTISTIICSAKQKEII
jgi:hypothetical protein